MIKHTRGVLTTPCMLIKMENNYPLCSFCRVCTLKVDVSPLPIIRSVFCFNKSLDAVFIINTLIKKIKKKVNRFFSNTKSIHKLHPLLCVLYKFYCSVKSLFFKCFYGITGMQVLYIFFLTRIYNCERININE